MNWQYLADLAMTFDSTNAIFKPNRIKARNQHDLIDQINQINAIKIKVPMQTITMSAPSIKKQVKRQSTWSTLASVI